MKKFRFFSAAIFFFLCLGLTNSCSQPDGSTVKKTFEATIPCDDAVKEMLGIPADYKCEMMKWNLTLYRNSKNIPSAFNLIYTYGIPKQGTRGFTEGAKTIELKGKWTIEKGYPENIRAAVITLTADSSLVSLSFLQPGQNLLHLLNKEKQLVIGNGAWSYTLNSTDPSKKSSNKFTSQPVQLLRINSVSDTVGIFDGRTPCNETLRNINNISADGCQLIKCRLILLQDPKTHTPTNFVILNVYVGKGDNRYSVTGSWKLTQGTIDDPTAIVYQLQPDPLKSDNQMLLLKADDNILFFLDNNTDFLVGNSYCSYTLNRAR